MTTEEIQASLSSVASATVEGIDALLHSSFAIALVGALAGAYAGGMAAHRSMERSKARDELLREVRSTNAAIILAFTTCNTALALKKQLVAPMIERFRSERIAFQEFLAQRRTEQTLRNENYYIQADFVTFIAPFFPMEALRDVMYSRVGAQGKALNLVSQIDGAVTGLAGAVVERDKVIYSFRTQQPGLNELPFHYFGVTDAAGHTHREYADVLDITESYINDVIWFSAKLCEQLVGHGVKRNELFKERFGKDALKINEPDFSGPKELGLFPPDSDYSSWSNWMVEEHSESSDTELV